MAMGDHAEYVPLLALFVLNHNVITDILINIKAFGGSFCPYKEKQQVAGLNIYDYTELVLCTKEWHLVEHRSLCKAVSAVSNKGPWITHTHFNRGGVLVCWFNSAKLFYRFLLLLPLRYNVFFYIHILQLKTCDSLLYIHL